MYITIYMCVCVCVSVQISLKIFLKIYLNDHGDLSLSDGTLNIYFVLYLNVA